MPDVFDEIQETTDDTSQRIDVFDEISETQPAAQSKSEKIAKSLKFYGVKPKAATIESIRQKVGTGLRGLAGGLIGTPSDIVKLLTKVAKAPLGGLLGKPVGKAAEKITEFLPTSEKVEQFFDTMAGEKFEPKTTTEKLIANTASGLGAILLGGPLKATTRLPSGVRTVMAAVAPAVAMTATEKADLPPWAQAASAIGASLLVHKFTGKNIKSVRNEWYRKADKLAEGKSIKAESLNKNLSKLETLLYKGGKTGPKEAVKKLANEVKGKIHGGRIGLDELIEFKKNINERMGEFEKIKGSKGFWKMLGGMVDKGIGQYEKFNPEFKKVFRQANSLHKGLREARVIESFIKSHPIISAEAGLVLNMLPGGAVTKVGILKGGELVAAFARNPGLRKAYFEVLKNASKNEVRGTLNAVKKFNAEAQQQPELLD